MFQHHLDSGVSNYHSRTARTRVENNHYFWKMVIMVMVKMVMVIMVIMVKMVMVTII